MVIVVHSDYIVINSVDVPSVNSREATLHLVLYRFSWRKMTQRGKSFLIVSGQLIGMEEGQGLVNVQIEHHPTIGDIIFNKDLNVMSKIPNSWDIYQPRRGGSADGLILGQCAPQQHDS